MESKKGYLGFVGYQEWAKSDFFFESGVMMMRRIGKVEKNSIWRGKDGLLEARKQAGAVVQEARRGGPSEETVRPSVCRRCMLAAAGCLTDPIEHDDLALRDMAVIVVQRQVVLSGPSLPMILGSHPSWRGLTWPVGGCI